MKKLFLSGFVILTFVIYSIQQRHEKPITITTPSPLIPNGQNSQTSQATQSTPSSSTTPISNQQAVTYKNGSYTGDVADAFYGNIQVKVTIQANKITDIIFLQYPNDRRNSIEINQYAMPSLKQEAIKAQSARVDIVSGATDTSNAFVESLSTALVKAS